MRRLLTWKSGTSNQQVANVLGALLHVSSGWDIVITMTYGRIVVESTVDNNYRLNDDRITPYVIWTEV